MEEERAEEGGQKEGREGRKEGKEGEREEGSLFKNRALL